MRFVGMCSAHLVMDLWFRKRNEFCFYPPFCLRGIFKRGYVVYGFNLFSDGVYGLEF